MKIAIISDLHLGFRQYGSVEREKDFYNQFLFVCKEINKYSPEIVIIAGDLFNKPNPSPMAINIYRKGILSLNSIVCTIKGNHTMILRDNHFSIDDFFEEDEIEGYFYLDDSSYENLNVHIDGITYRNNTNINEFIDVQKNMAKKCLKDNYNILVVHQSFKEFCGFTGEELSIEDIDYSPYSCVICGHIHSRFDAVLSNGTKFIQPGSIERMNTTEALDEQRNGKGFYLLDTKDNSLEFHQVKSQREFLLGEIKLQKKEDLENHLNELKKTVSKMKEAPIISYTYKNNIKNIDSVREQISHLTENALLNNSNIDDESQEDISIEITDSEIPTVLESIKLYGEKSGLSEKECSLAVDLHQALNSNLESVDGLLKDYYEKNKKHEEEKIFEEDNSLKEIMEYFGE